MNILRAVAFAVVALATLDLAPAHALTADEVRVRIEAEFPRIEVLRVVPAETGDGRPAWLVTVMNRGGAYNDAFQVRRVLVDRETGVLTPVGEPFSGAGAASEGFGENLRTRSLAPIPGRP